ncbi:MAG: ATP-binding cassette domain-containing protein [Candidatus Marinimicrobia bacterium]|nr:ATP-binding cassette domain-containing protein [Candidatus Neomarinimicrobiota bacterium]
MSYNMLVLEGLTKKYEGVHAVDNVSFKVEKGDVYGFLGPNGAGKTTTIRMIMGIIYPDTGSINLNGENINALGRYNLGYLPEDRGLYQKQRLEEILNYFGLLRGLERSDAKNRSSMWLERFGLGDQGSRKVEELSKGNQQKIQFILSLLHDPDLIILDEPFTGLDPLNQLLLKEIIQEKQDEGKTIIFSTHQMEQVERLCNNICLIDKGSVIVEGSLEDIRKKHSSDAVEVRFSGEIDEQKASSYFNELEITDDTLSGVLSKDPNEFLGWVNASVDVLSFQLKVPTLEQIFLEEVGKKK